MQKPNNQPERKADLQVGIHTVAALIKANPMGVNHIILQIGTNNPELHKIQKDAGARKIKVHQLPLAKLNYFYKGNHQGVIAFLNGRPLDDWESVKARIFSQIESGSQAKIVLMAGIEDPRNFGACIRSSLGLGCDAVIFSSHGSCGLTPSAAKASSGASSKIPICSVGNLETELKNLEEAGFSIIGLDGSSRLSVTQVNPQQNLVIVIGGEDKGIPPHIARQCHKLYQIPIKSEAHSYNASVALSLFLYEINRQLEFPFQ